MANDNGDSSLPLAELHLHLEGAIAPAMVRRLAARNGVALPDGLITPDNRFAWQDFTSFLNAYDAASMVLVTADDYAELTADYLTSIAQDGAIYAELTISPDHSARAGIGYEALVEGVAAGIGRASAQTGIEARMIVTCIRHFGAERASKVARMTAAFPHPLVTGFGMAGDERFGRAANFRPAFEIARAAGLGATVHAGEISGASSVADALDLPVTRIGHGVRAIEHPPLVDMLAERGLVLEVCPGSNIALKIFEQMTDHPLDRLRAAGVRVTLNSDDPSFFDTTLKAEYRTARDVFGWSPSTLRAATRTAIEAAFIDDSTRARLLRKLEESSAP
ncbi:adenosine deaminase [Fodinicurvata sp. EGI_FJ10296]|uniref:adenosine deaminase n=1 Tax=Fodinicurvata sp. EGI_FJ10296 TaxID=3231908 RepID=UPI0034551529